MKTLGLIGGIGPESTIEYYRLIVAGYRERTGGSNPSIVINSVDVQRLLTWMTADELQQVVDYLATEIRKLEQAGVDCAALAANTPHIVFDEIQQRVSVPLVSIVEATCEKARTLGLGTLGLLGTRFTMSARFYPDVFTRSGLKLVVPNDEEQAFIHDKYINELLKDIFLPETREQLLHIADRLKARSGIEGIILGGTELPLLLRDEKHNELPLLDTTRIHVERIVEELLA